METSGWDQSMRVTWFLFIWISGEQQYPCLDGEAKPNHSEVYWKFANRLRQKLSGKFLQAAKESTGISERNKYLYDYHWLRCWLNRLTKSSWLIVKRLRSKRQAQEPKPLENQPATLRPTKIFESAGIFRRSSMGLFSHSALATYITK